MKLRRIGRDRLNFMPHFVWKQKSVLISCRLNFMSPCFHVALISCFKVIVMTLNLCLKHCRLLMRNIMMMMLMMMIYIFSNLYNYLQDSNQSKVFSMIIIIKKNCTRNRLAPVGPEVGKKFKKLAVYISLVQYKK